MCTCITYENGDFYFGRNLDLEYSFGERVVITPRNHPLTFKRMESMGRHYGMIGMAAVMEEYPMYAEAVNEKGLCMAGLNFPGNAFYPVAGKKKYQVTPYEVIPWLLGQCSCVSEAVGYLKETDLTGIPFAPEVPLAPLHFMLADRKEAWVAEPVEEGLKLYENPFGVLTNNPPFPFHLMNLRQYLNLTAQAPENRFGEGLDMEPFGQGMGAIGLPGDASPASRFVRAAFLRWNSRAPREERANVSQLFHMLDSVSMVRGMVLTEEGREDVTTYSCCVNACTGVYYFKTYDNHRIQAVEMRREDLDGSGLISYELPLEEDIRLLNRDFWTDRPICDKIRRQR